MGWAYLIIAVIFEIAWASTLKWIDGYTRPGPTAVNVLLCVANLWVLAQALKVLPTALPTRCGQEWGRLELPSWLIGSRESPSMRPSLPASA